MKMSLFSVLLAFFGWLCLTLCYVVELTVACVSTETQRDRISRWTLWSLQKLQGRRMYLPWDRVFLFQEKGRKCAFEANSIYLAFVREESGHLQGVLSSLKASVWQTCMAVQCVVTCGHSSPLSAPVSAVSVTHRQLCPENSKHKLQK